LSCFTQLTGVPNSVVRRPSSGAQQSGRGGAGNFFKTADADAETKAANEKAIVDDGESIRSGDSAEKEKEKAKKRWLFGGKKE
jgi:hypothetical protein